MKTSILACLLVGLTLPPLVLAQTAQTTSPSGLPASGLPASGHPPAKNAHIASFHIETESALHIIYSDGTDVAIPKERGRFGINEQTLTHESFLDIQLADDRQHIGWLADYMMCAQSYPCPMELVIYRSGEILRRIPPPYGIIWRWKFLEGGKQIVIQFGFPHGDATGAYALYDTETGRELATFSPTENKEAPDWVQQLRHSNR